MLRTTIEKEWGEVRCKRRGKVEDWSWMVSFYDTREWDDPLVDRHWYKTEQDAKFVSAMFEAGNFKYGKYTEVLIDNAFCDDVEVGEDA